MTEFKNELDKFDPKVAELQKVASTAKEVVVTDIRDETQLGVAKTKRLELMRIRTSIEKTGKSLRDDANAFNKAVLTKQKELIAIVEPEEQRLAAIEEEGKKAAEIDERKKSLPERLEKLGAINDSVEITEGELLEMDELQFGIYYNGRIENWNLEEKRKLEEQAQLDLEKKEADAKLETERKEKEAAEAQRVADVAQAKIDAENAKIEERKRELEKEKRELEHMKELDEAKKIAEAEAVANAEKKAEEEKEAEAQRVADAEKKETAEKKALEKKKEYIKFLSDNGYSEVAKNDFYIKDDSDRVVLYKKVGEFSK